MSLDKYKLTEEQKVEFLKKETIVLNDAEKLNEYQNFVSSQKNSFLLLMNYINKLLIQYKKQGDLSYFVELRARIKTPESALTNDKEKALDDIFGMEIICATEEEIDFCVKQLSNFMNTFKSKEHNKPNGYKAKHYYLFMQDDKQELLYNNATNLSIEPMPLVEFQFKTIDVAIKAFNGSADHSVYKKVDKKQIQKSFDKNELKVGFNLPFMWVSSIDINKPEMKLLSADETAKVLYPFIDVTSREKTTKTK